MERLMAVEKRTRSAGDALATSKVAVAMLRLGAAVGDWAGGSATALALTKRRGQLKTVIADVVTEGIRLVGEVGDAEARVGLITTLRTITEGRIYVEVERARLTKQLAGIREGEGKVGEASEILQEVAVETFGSMEKREKADFLLEQVRLTAATGDYSRMAILANKITKRVLDEAGMEDLRVRYYDLMVALHQQQRDALALCRDYQAVYATRGYAADPAKWQPALAAAIVYLALAPYDNTVSDLLHRVRGDIHTEDLPAHRALLTYLTTDELIPWPLPAPHHATLLASPAFALPAPTPAGAAAAAAAGASGDVEMSSGGGGGAAGAAAGVAAPRLGARAPRSLIVPKDDEDRVGWAAVFRKRIVQHNVRVVAKWYTRIHTARLAGLLGLDDATAEAVGSEMSGEKVLHAKIDRPAGVTVFGHTRPATEVLTAFTSDIDTVMALAEKTRHLIEKERMVRSIGGAGGAARA